MTIHPGPLLAECVAYVTGERTDPPKRAVDTGSTNRHVLALLTGVLRDHDGDGRELARKLRVQLGLEAPRKDTDHVGIYGDELGSGYAPIQDQVVLAAILFERRGGSVPGDLIDACRRWWGASLCLRAVLATRHRGSVLVLPGPAARQRYAVPPPELSVPLQITIGEPPMRYGINGGASRPDAVVYDWKDADEIAAEYRRLMGVMPSMLAEEYGVGYRDLRALIFHADAGLGTGVARGLRSKFPLHVRRYASGVAAWWPSFQSHDAPTAGGSSVDGKLYALQPQPLGPRAGVDTQHWGGDQVQRAVVDGDRLVGTFRTARGVSRPGREVVAQTQWIPLPPGESVLSLVIDQDGAREQGQAPPRVVVPTEPPPSPAPSPAPQPPRVGELVATRAQVESLLAFVDLMIAGEAGRGASSRLRAMIADLLR